MVLSKYITLCILRDGFHFSRHEKQKLPDSSDKFVSLGGIPGEHFDKTRDYSISEGTVRRMPVSVTQTACSLLAVI